MRAMPLNGEYGTVKSARQIVAAGVLVVASLAVGTAAEAQELIRQVRAAIAADGFTDAERILAESRSRQGETPEWMEAYSWLGRGALAAGRLEQANRYATETYTRALQMLKGRTLDAEPRLPIALGAAIEVRAQVAARQGSRSEAVAVLRRELNTYRTTSLTKRIQKNINLLSLEGTVAPPLDLSESLSKTPLSLDAVKGKVTLLFFWAHWCPDCKAEAPILERLLARYGSQGLVVIAPTQRYGYVAGGRDATPDEENRYIENMRATLYSFLAPETVTLSEVNHQRYGVSTTPTLVLTDRKGIVRSYHPGGMSEAELDSLIRDLLAGRLPETGD